MSSNARGLVGELAVGALTGLVGTTAMTITTWVQKRQRDVDDLPVDYDATQHVATAAANVLRVEPRDDTEVEALFLLTHWGYGSLMGAAHRTLVRQTTRPRAALVFFAGCQTMALVLLPVLGETPPPWRWRRDVIASSLAQHAVYALAVALADRSAAARIPDDWRD